MLEFRFWTLTDVNEDTVLSIHPPIHVEGWVSFVCKLCRFRYKTLPNFALIGQVQCPYRLTLYSGREFLRRYCTNIYQLYGRARMFLSRVIIRWWFISITISCGVYSPLPKILLSRRMLRFFHKYLFVIELHIYFPATGEWMLEETFQ